MARVLKHVAVKEKQAECEHCGCTIAYVQNEVQEYHGRDMSGGPDGQKWVVCPSCHKNIILESW